MPEASAVDVAEARCLIWKRGRQIRTAARLKQAEVGRELGVHGNNIGNWENGVTVPSFDMAIRYAELLRKLEEVVP